MDGIRSNVTVRKLEVRNYNSPRQLGALQTRRTDCARNVTVTECDVHHNYGGGIRLVGPDMEISHSSIHHQHQLGFSLNHATNAKVFGNDIFMNN